MVDVVDRETRSRMMSGIKGKDTAGELLIRRALHKKGYRYRLHRKDLPGRPDLVLPRHNAVIFVNGCFWHGHDCHLFKWPKTRPDFWEQKITGNKQRDARNIQNLSETGWRYCLVWECSFRGKNSIAMEDLCVQITDWLSSSERILDLSGD